MAAVGDVRAPWLMQALIGVSLLFFGTLLYVTSYTNFFWDEWNFIESRRQWNLDVLLIPHAEHWSTIPVLIWKILFVVVGIRTHVPFEAALLIGHLAAVFLLFTFIRRRSGDVPAFAAALVLLLLGTGGTDIVWAFQIGFVGSVAFGLLAMQLIERDQNQMRRLIAAFAALLGSLMCSAVGLAFLVALAVQMVADSRLRRLAPTLFIPAALFGGWFLLYGAGLPGTPGAPCPDCGPGRFSSDIHTTSIGLSYVMGLAAFVASGLEASAEAVFGVAGAGTLFLPAVAAVVAIRVLWQRQVEAWQLGMAAGAVAWFALTGLGRLQNGPEGAAASRYVYVGAVFLLPLVANAVRVLPWRHLWRPVLIVAFAVSLLGNVLQLRDRALVDPVPGIRPLASQTEVMRVEDAELQTVDLFRGAPDMKLDVSPDPAIMPQLTVRDYFAAIDELGSPVPTVRLDSLTQLPHYAVDRVLINLFRDALTVQADNSRSIDGNACETVDSSAGSTIDFQAPDGQFLTLQPSKGGDAYLSLGFLNPPVAEPFLSRVPLAAQTENWVHIPNTGRRSVVWQLRIQTLALGAIRVCSTGSLSYVRSAGSTFKDEPESFTHSPGWAPAGDATALDGQALRAEAGTLEPNGAFGKDFLPAPIAYDIWYRVRVNSTAGTTPEMILSVVDGTANRYLTYTTLKPRGVGSAYTWLLIASNVFPPPGHVMRFQVNITAKLSTDWYIDAAIMQPAGTAPPQRA